MVGVEPDAHQVTGGEPVRIPGKRVVKVLGGVQGTTGHIFFTPSSEAGGQVLSDFPQGTLEEAVEAEQGIPWAHGLTPTRKGGSSRPFTPLSTRPGAEPGFRIDKSDPPYADSWGLGAPPSTIAQQSKKA